MHAAPPAGQPLLLDRITHQYAGHKAVDGITLDIGGGELVALLGPSGCGKTTLLRIVAGLAEPYPVARSAHYKDLIPVAQEPDGPAPFFQVVGLTYNPETVKAPSTSWADLWNPVYKNRVGITNLASTLGTGFLVEVARMRGGSETNVEC